MSVTKASGSGWNKEKHPRDMVGRFTDKPKMGRGMPRAGAHGEDEPTVVDGVELKPRMEPDDVTYLFRQINRRIEDDPEAQDGLARDFRQLMDANDIIPADDWVPMFPGDNTVAWMEHGVNDYTIGLLSADPDKPLDPDGDELCWEPSDDMVDMASVRKSLAREARHAREHWLGSCDEPAELQAMVDGTPDKDLIHLSLNPNLSETQRASLLDRLDVDDYGNDPRAQNLLIMDDPDLSGRLKPYARIMTDDLLRRRAPASDSWDAEDNRVCTIGRIAANPTLPEPLMERLQRKSNPGTPEGQAALKGLAANPNIPDRILDRIAMDEPYAIPDGKRHGLRRRLGIDTAKEGWGDGWDPQDRPAWEREVDAFIDMDDAFDDAFEDDMGDGVATVEDLRRLRERLLNGK